MFAPEQPRPRRPLHGCPFGGFVFGQLVVKRIGFPLPLGHKMRKPVDRFARRNGFLEHRSALGSAGLAGKRFVLVVDYGAVKGVFHEHVRVGPPKEPVGVSFVVGHQHPVGRLKAEVVRTQPPVVGPHGLVHTAP